MTVDEIGYDVAVVGLGPAGRALVYRCAEAGLKVVAIDLHPDRTWTPTYAAWRDELPPWLPDEVIAAAVERPSAWTSIEHPIEREYVVLDTEALQRVLSLEKAQVIAVRAVTLTATTVVLADGTTVHARLVIDARGVARDPALAEQTAFGLILPADNAVPALDGAQALFMDWRRDNGSQPAAAPSFLYAVPLDGHRFLLEETCLVGRPPLALSELEQRLRTRLRNRGVELSGDEAVERVHFPVETDHAQPARRATGPLPYGSRGGLMHPGTGYSVAASLMWSDAVAEAVRAGQEVRRALWPARGRVAYRLRRVGLALLLDLGPDEVSPFFGAFFSLPAHVQERYLSRRADAAGHALLMTRLFVRVPARVKLKAMRAGMSGVGGRKRVSRQ